MSSNQHNPASSGTDEAGANTDNESIANKKTTSTELVSSIGYILAVSYPLLAISTGVRAGYQLLVREDVVNYFPPAMSAVAALCYLVATIGFAYRYKWSWWLSILSLGVETIFTLIIGTMSYIEPALIGSTVWRHFGADYGYFPLFQPILGLIWLVWPETLRQYGFKYLPLPWRSNSE